MIKKLLRRVLGKASLHYKELMTVLCDCEAVIKSRPLTYVSECTYDLTPLTPSMFLQEAREVGVLDLDTLNQISLSKRLVYRQKLMEDLRKRFRVEYLGQLLQRGCPTSGTREVNIGEIVIIGSDNAKKIDWPIGRIIAFYPGKDGKARVVRVKTAKGEYVRPVQRIYPMEVTSSVPLFPEADALPRSESVPIHSGLKPILTRSGRVVKIPSRLLC